MRPDVSKHPCNSGEGIPMDQSKPISRRAWMKRALMAATALVVWPIMGRPARAATEHKVTKASVHYQDHPDSGKMCGMCRYFIPPGGVAGHGMMGGMMGGMGPGMMKAGTCELVQGRINLMGYCDLYAPV